MTKAMRTRTTCVAVLVTAVCGSGAGAQRPDRPADRPVGVIGHRGASAYAPEHTVAAYQLAIDLGADFIEPDLQMTRDGVLIALHDETLDRTTDVEDVFPDRFRVDTIRGEPVRRWYASDFTLAEIERLDAGSWFDPRFAGARIPTFARVVEVARGRVGLYPETKSPGMYAELGFQMERLVVEELGRHGLDRRGADPRTPVVLQSFSPTSLRILREELGSDLDLTLVMSEAGAIRWITPEGLEEARAFATAIGPAKELLLSRPEVVTAAHEAGLAVVPWTFHDRGSGPFATLDDEMVHFVCVLGVDAVFTNNPDRVPVRCDGR